VKHIAKSKIAVDLGPCPRPSGSPPEIWEAARFDVDTVGGGRWGLVCIVRHRDGSNIRERRSMVVVVA
jgi:hypothetical protein